MRLYDICLEMVVLIGYVIAASGQSESLQLSGQVTDFVSGEYLSDVTVSITNLNSGKVDTVNTNSSGYWDFTLVSRIDDKETIPANFYVSSPYPNPFNPKTKIDFSLPFRSPVKITVYNILGEVVDSKNSDLNAGVYSINWEGTGAAGIYFINIRTNQSSITKKVTQLDGLSGSGLSNINPGRNRNIQFSKTFASIPIQLILSKFGYIADTITTEVESGKYFESSLSTIHSQLKLFDLHNDVLEMIYYNEPDYHLADLHDNHHTDIPRLKLGGVDYQFFAIWVNPGDTGYYDSAIEMFDIFNRERFLNMNDLGQARTAQGALALNQDNKIAGILAVEGGHVLENDLLKIDTLYNLGMRYLTITWNNSTDWAISAQDERSATVGLSDFGRQVIHRLDSLGIIIDVSHVGIKTIEDILQTTNNPIIATHSGARELYDHYRNLNDDQIIAIANSGGVIGVVFYHWFLSGSNRNISQVVDHIDYIKNLVGIDHVALGSDFDGISSMITGLEDVSKFPNLTLELLKRGYSRADIEKILSENIMRVFTEVCHN
jgi:membrane dipeptidase